MLIIIALLLLIMAMSIPVIGDVIAGIFAFWLVAEGAYMLIKCFVKV